MMLRKKLGILGFTARNRRSVDNRNAFYKRFCTCQSTRFCKQNIRGVHINGNLVCETDRDKPLFVFEAFFKLVNHLFIVARDYDNFRILRSICQNETRRIYSIAETHASAHNKRNFLVFSKTEFCPRRSLVGRNRKLLCYRDS